MSALVLAAAGAGDAATMGAAALGILSSGVTLLLHLGLTFGAAIILRRVLLAGQDGGVALLGVLALLAAGPFGAAGAFALTLLGRGNAGTDARLSDWYARIALSASQDDLTQLSDRVAIGRSANLAAPPPGAFADLFRSGPISAQQAALGVIARAFHPDYLPVLKMALESPEPVIRVQAAAVAARVRVPLQSRIAEQIKRAANPSIAAAEAVDIARQLEVAIASGLLEEGNRAAAAGVHDALLSRTFAHADADARAKEAGGASTFKRAGQDGDMTADAYALHLLAQNRFAEFRIARLKFRRRMWGRYRQRIVVVRPARPGLRLVPLAPAVRVHP